MPQYLGDRRVNSIVRLMWNTTAVAGESITRATNGSIRIYKNDSTTERTSSAGITDTEDFDGEVGVHHLKIDLADNTDAGFYAAGNDYFVVLADATIDGKAISACLAMFSIENLNQAVDVVKLSGDGAAADNAEAFFDGTGYAGTNNVIPTVTNVTNMVTANVIQISGDGTSADNLETYTDGTTPMPVNAISVRGQILGSQVGVNVNTLFNNDDGPSSVILDNIDGRAALVAFNLDHLMGFAVTGGDVADNSALAKLVSKAATPDWDTFVNTTDALEAIRDNMGTPQTGDAFARIGANGAGLTAVPWNAAWDTEVESEVADALAAVGLTTTVTGRIDAAISSRAATGAAMTLANNAITTAAINDGAITSAKFTVAAIAGVATGILEKLDQLWRRFFKKHVHDKTAKTIKTFADNGSTVLTTQSYTSDATTDDVGAAT